MPRRRGGTGGGSAGGGGAAAALGESGTLRALAGVAVAVALTWWGTTLWDKLVDNVVPLAFVVFCLAAALSALSPDETAAATGQLAPSGRHSLLAAHDDLPGPPTPGSESDGYPASSRGGRGGRSRSQPYLALVAGGNGSSGSGPATRRRVLSAIGFETDSSDSSSGALVVAADRSGALARMCTLNCSVCNSRHFAPDISRRMRCDVHGSHPAQPGSVWREEVAAPGGRVQLRTLLAWDGGVLDVTDSLGVCHGWTAELTRLHLSTLQRCGRRRQCSRAMMLDKYVEAAAMDPRIRQHYERWKRGNQGGGGGGGRALEIEMAARRGAG